jgi:hypothetical protein
MNPNKLEKGQRWLFKGDDKLLIEIVDPATGICLVKSALSASCYSLGSKHCWLVSLTHACSKNESYYLQYLEGQDAPKDT